MENGESSLPQAAPNLAGPVPDAALRPPLTAAQAVALFIAAEPAFRSGSSGASREWHPPRVEDLQKVLPQYDNLEFIARGGMGAVYRARQPSLSRTVAIKVLPPEVADNDLSFADRFANEARAMARLSHPNIVTVYDAGKTQDGLLYFVMEFVEGSDLAKWIAENHKLEPSRALEIAIAVCDALTAAHEGGIIHRDIKPSNIILDKRGRVKVADFGLAKAVISDTTLLTHSEMALGTPDYAAPEIRTPGGPVDQRADLYALGVTLYQMLTGQIPRGRFQPLSQLVQQTGPRFDRVIDRALQSDPDRRYATSAEMKEDLERLLRHCSTPRSSTQKAPWLKIVLPISIFAALSALVWSLLIELPPDPAPVTNPAKAVVRPPPTRRFARSTPEGKAEAVWESRWHKPGRIRAAGTDMNARPFDLSAAEPFADFVQVFIVDRGHDDDVAWVGLRANGKVVWSDGTLEVGRVGFARSGGEVEPILYGARVEPPSMPAPQIPVTDYSFGRMAFLPGKPPVIAYADLAGMWHVASPAFDSGQMPRPDLISPPKVIQVVVDSTGIGVLRENGSLRVWNLAEIPLPEILALGIRDVLPMGNSWAVLNTQGKVLNFAIKGQGSSGEEYFPQPLTIREFFDSDGTAIDLASGGYSPLVKHADGHWTTDPTLKLISETLATLHRQNNQSFSAFHSLARQGILWIEPAE